MKPKTAEPNIKEVDPALLRDLVAPQPFQFQFKRPYSGLYKKMGDKFVLRQEHVEELKRLVEEYNKERAGDLNLLSMSDFVNAALDFALEHPLVFQYQIAPIYLREVLAEAIYRKAFLHFVQHELL